LGSTLKAAIWFRWHFKKEYPDAGAASDLTAAGYPDAELQGITGRPSFIIRVPKGSLSVDDLSKQIQKDVQEKVPGSDPVIELRSSWDRRWDMPWRNRPSMRTLWACVLIIAYVAFRFRSTLWGVCSILAMVHDVLFNHRILFHLE
jgi:preprotein translocase subunit SecF